MGSLTLIINNKIAVPADVILSEARALCNNILTIYSFLLLGVLHTLSNDSALKDSNQASGALIVLSQLQPISRQVCVCRIC